MEPIFQVAPKKGFEMFFYGDKIRFYGPWSGHPYSNLFLYSTKFAHPSSRGVLSKSLQCPQF